MVRTVVCQKEGCCGNAFYIETIDNKIQVTCKDCGSKYLFDFSQYDFTVISSCSICNNDTFKLFKDVDNGNIYAKCTNVEDHQRKYILIQMEFKYHMKQSCYRILKN